MSDKYIGLFDSGIGGLTVVKSVIERLPNENIVYFGDTAHVPYGTRSHKQIIEYALNDAAFLNTFNLKAMVIACNTADAVAGEVLKNRYDLPVYGVVLPASKKAIMTTRNNKIGVIATPASIDSKAYNKAIMSLNKDVEVYSKACPLLVPMVENGRYMKGDGVIEEILKEYLEPLKQKDIDTLILGCTHYPLLKDLIQDILPNVQLISSSDAAAEELANNLVDKNESSNPVHQYYVSDNLESFKKQASIFMPDDFSNAKLVNI